MQAHWPQSSSTSQNVFHFTIFVLCARLFFSISFTCFIFQCEQFFSLWIFFPSLRSCICIQFVCYLKYVCDVCISLRSTYIFRMWSKRIQRRKKTEPNRYTRLFFSVIVIFVCCLYLYRIFCCCCCSVGFVCVFYFWHQHHTDRWYTMWSLCVVFSLARLGLFELWDGLHILVTYALHAIAILAERTSKAKTNKIGNNKNLKSE